MTKKEITTVIKSEKEEPFVRLRGNSFWAKNVKRFYNLLKKLPPHVQVVIACIPSHVGISLNERNYGLAKAALISSLSAHKT